MRYPSSINKGDCIALCAPSFGCSKAPYKNKLNAGIKYFENNGYKIFKGNHLYTLKNCESDTSKKRADDFIKLYKSSNNSLVWSIAGGEIMFDILQYIDFNELKLCTPKYFIGYSDNTNLTFLLTTICDVATIYAMHITDFGVNKLHKQNSDLLSLINGKKYTFNSYAKYERESLKYENPLSPLNLKYETKYQLIEGSSANITGRIIGGCLDILEIICGTKYDYVKQFIEKYKESGIIWYFDSCDYNSLGFYRALMHLSEAGWFKYVKGFVIGRVNNTAEPFEFTFKYAMSKALSKYNVPIIFDADIGHVPPSIPILNGSIANITLENERATFKFIRK